ncbi:MAG TPA: S9 family peptidase [Cytophagales bacterium]|jgi:dipeptidyl aminopeptidase/acylaminoacyl peptidase|nr:S9 family peptidase [Cytophagales bacterium]
MKKILLTVLSIPILMSCSDSKKQEQADEAFETYTIEQFYENVSYYGGAFSPDESKLLVGNNSTGVFNAYEIDLASGTETALTQSDSNSIWAVSYFPEDERILYQSDNDGDEIDHIYVRQTDGTVEDLTPVEGAKANFMKWQRDNKSFLFTSNQREPRFFDLYEMDLETFSPGMLYQNDMGLDISAVSVDKRYLALVKNITTSKSEMHLFDRETDELTQLSPAGAEATFSPQFFSLDGEFLYYLTNLDDEFTYLSRYNMSSGATEKVFGTNWDVWYAYHTHNEKYRIIGINADGRTEIKIFDLASGEEVAFPEMPGKDIKGVNVSDSETLVRLTVGSSKSPNDIYLYNFETGSLEKLTDALNPDINAGHLVDAEVIRYESYDGLEIPSIYYKPKNASADNKAPALVWVHGGPGGQSRVGYFSLIQYLVNHGYAILAVNNRGSSGYGKTFYEMDNQKHGDVDLKDCVAAKEYLAGLEYIDGEKIGIIGGSYGGYMVMAALTFEPEVFEAGVNIFGVTNWLRTLRSIPPYWESFREALYDEMGNPNTEDSVRLYNISPLFHADQVTKPLMVLQGANDPRVLQVESDEIVEAVKANDVPVVYELYPDEGHGFVKKENEIKGYGRIKEFLDEYLKGEKEG